MIDINFREIWILLFFSNPHLILLFSQLISCVERCVLQYFITFRFCWITILKSLEILICGYYYLLTHLIDKLLVYPTDIISMSGAVFMVGIVFHFLAGLFNLCSPVYSIYNKIKSLIHSRLL